MKLKKKKRKIECIACGRKIETVDKENVIYRGKGWVNYQCPNCSHVTRIAVEEGNEKP